MFFRLQITLLSLALCSILSVSENSYSATFSEPLVLKDINSVAEISSGVEIHSGAASMRVVAISDSILRIRVSPDGFFRQNKSWAVIPSDGKDKPEVRIKKEKNRIRMQTALLDVSITGSPLRIEIRDQAGNLLSSDSERYPIEYHGPSFVVSKDLREDDHFFGLGDKSGPLDRRAQAFALWNTDAYRWQESTDPLYKAIPFFLGMRQGKAYGIFLDNTWRSYFDFGRSLREVFSFGSEGGDLDYYFIAGPDPKQVVERYTNFTGRSPLPPLWTLGYQQSRYSYESALKVKQVADRLRQDHIPVDAIYLDIGFQYKNRPFTVDKDSFPDLKKMIGQLHAQDLHVVAITDLHIAQANNESYQPYESGASGDHFVKNPDGSTYVGKVWPGDSVFPDFTRASTRKWWGSLYRDFYVQDGIDGFWNDMNEPSIFDQRSKTMPLLTQHRVSELDDRERIATHAEIHNVYGMENSRATKEGLENLKPELRPFVLTRATYAGGQRYAATWTGDNSSTWNHLKIGTAQLLNLGVSGFPLVGQDIGGYAGTPSAELLTKWFFVGAFQPIFRDHSELNSAPQEPWVHGPEQESLRRRAIEERYRLLPYFYTLAEEASRTGLPINRPMFLEFPEMASIGDGSDNQFMVGSSLLVAPSPYPEALDDYGIALPPASKWFDYWTGKRVQQQISTDSVGRVSSGITAKNRSDNIPVLVKAGSIIPRQPLVQSTGEKPNGNLELLVYAGANGTGSLYLDDGLTLRYQHGDSLRLNFALKSEEDALVLALGQPEGKYNPWWKQVDVKIFGIDGYPLSMTLNGEELPKASWTYDVAAEKLEFTLKGWNRLEHLKIKLRK